MAALFDPFGIVKGIFGGDSEQSIRQTYDIENVNQNIFKQITTYQQTISATNENTQSVLVDVDYMDTNCDITIGQYIDATIQSTAELTTDTVAQVRTTVDTDLQAAAEAAMDKITEAFNLQSGDRQNIEQDVKLKFKNILDRTFETNNLTEIINKAVNTQDGKVTIRYCNGKFDFTQNVVAKLVATSITDALVKAIAEDSLLQKIAFDFSSKQRTENKGIADIVKAIGDILPWKWIALACAAICVVLIIGAVVMGRSPAGQNAVRNFSKSQIRGRRF